MPQSMDPTPVEPFENDPNPTAAPYRIDVKLHDVLMDAGTNGKHTNPPRPPGRPDEGKLTLPEPVYPQRVYSDDDEPTLVEYQRLNAWRVWNAWAKPYFQSRSLENRKKLRPIIA